MILTVVPQDKRTGRPSGLRLQVMACPRRNAPALAIYDVPSAAEPAQFEDDARLLHPDCAQGTARRSRWRGVADHARAGRIGPAEPICQDVLRRRGAVQLGKTGRSDIASAGGAQERCSAAAATGGRAAPPRRDAVSDAVEKLVA